MQLFLLYLLSVLPFFEKPPFDKPVFETAMVDSCDGTYMKVFGDPGVAEYTHAFLTTPDGNLLIGGGRGNTSLLMLVTPGGDLLWSKTFDFTGGDDFIFEMMLDSEGRLVATGRDQLNAATTTFVFRYNLQTHTVLWAKTLPSSYSRWETILEKTAGGNYFLLGMVDDNNMFVEMNRTNGNVVLMKPFDYGQTDFFLTGKVHNGAIYSAGLQRNGGLDAIRASMTKLSLTGTELWTRFYFNSLNETARTYFYENLIENDTIVAYGRGDLNGDSFTDGEILLMKANLNGDFLWAKRYNLPNSNTEFSGSFIPLPDGYIMQGNHILNANGESQFFIIRVNKQGNLVWAKSIKSIGGDWGKYAAYHDGFIYFAGRTSELDNAGDVLLGKISLDGEVGGPGCDYVTDLQVTVNNVAENYDGVHDLTEIGNSYALNNANDSPVDVLLDDNYLPGCECTEPNPVDTCANGLPINTVPDAVLQSITGECIGGTINFTIVICNASGTALPAGTPFDFYLGNPTVMVANLLVTETVPFALQAGGCLELSGQLPLPTNEPIFVVLNANGTTPTPYDLGPDFPYATTQECDYTNNMGSFMVSYTPPVLDLGPDQFICNFEVTELDAGAGFESYQWSIPGNAGQTLTATGPGTYAVTVTDQCGGTQTDQVTLSVNPASVVDLGYDSVQICVGETFSFSVDGFVTYQWFPASLVDCPTCPSVTVSPVIDTCFIVQATSIEGCISADTVCVELVTDTAFVYQSTKICEGDTLLFNGDSLTQPGTYQSVDATGSCVQVTILTLSFHEKPVLDFTTELACPFAFDGVVTVLPNGGLPPYSFQWENDTVFTNQLTNLDVGTYAVTVTDANGCSTIGAKVLGAAMRPIVTSEEQGVSCFGVNDGVLTLVTDDPNLQYLFHDTIPTSQTMFENLWAGGDQYFIVDTFGCKWVQFFFIDSPEKIKLELPNSIEAEMCDSVQIEASANTSPLTWSWSPSEDLSCTDCPDPIASPFVTTTYFVTVMDSSGCSASDSVQVRVDFEGRAFIPNAFSPNDDGINDVFYVFSKCVSEVRLLRVFDRWGEKVFEASNTPPNDPLFGWDGKFKGKNASSDVYVYYIVVVLPDGTEREYKGDLTLLR